VSGRRLLWVLLRAFARMLFLLCFRVRVYRQNRVPPKGGALIASNHQSYLDPVLLGLGLDRSICYMARSSLFRNPLFRLLIASLNAFPVKRGGRDTTAVREAVRRLRGGWCLTVFPEGTRTPDGSVGRIHAGALLIAERTGVPVVPAAIEGAFEAWPRNGWPRPGRISVAYGRPIPPQEYERLSREELAERLHREIVTLQTDLKMRIGREVRQG